MFREVSLNRITALIIFIALLASFTGCSHKTEKEADLKPENRQVPNEKVETKDNRPVLVAFGNSLTEGAGVNEADSYPVKLQACLDKNGYGYRVINAGVSGETSSQGLNRTDSIIALKPVIVIVEFGANDGLRGIPAETVRRNLGEIIEKLQSSGIKVVLAGMEVPPNYGPQYSKSFRAIFSSLAEEMQVPLIPFFLEGVGGHPEMNQDDGIHPTSEGYDRVVENVWKVLQPLFKSTESESTETNGQQF